MRRHRLVALGVVVALVAGAALTYRERHVLAGLVRSLSAGSVQPNQPPSPPPDVVAITVNPAQDAHAISPYIYGASSWDPALLDGSHAGVVRWGGNPSSRYNWVLGNAWNAASDWEFRNDSYVDGAGSASDRFVRLNKAAGAASLITIPALGWVAKSNDNNDRSLGVPSDGGPAVAGDGAIAGYDPTANRARTSVPSYARKASPFQIQPPADSPAVYQDEWVNHLKALFGSAASGGVNFYAVDNEPDQWSFTHRDVAPARLGYDGLASTFTEYADAIKAVDPTAQVLGPELCCWANYIYSPLDRGNDNFATHADSRAHGGEEVVPWILDQVRKHDQATGRRSLDVLTLHWYPQGAGVYGDTSNPEVDQLRLRSTRSLYDPTYVDESWIAQRVDLIPRMKDWVAKHYPGTKIGITEYDFGGGKSISAALVEADALGIFGEQGLYLANYWYGPKQGTPAWFAFAMYRNFDGHGGSFGGISVQSVSNAPSAVAAYAATEPGWVDVMLINKELTSPQRVSLSVAGLRTSGAVQAYRYSQADLSSILKVASPGTGPVLETTLPAASITFLRIPTG